jgi:hypothetical protein
MSRKEFIVLAAALRRMKPGDDQPTTLTFWEKLVLEIGQARAESNPRFDWCRWDKACGISE